MKTKIKIKTKKINCNLTDVLHNNIIDAISGRGIDANSIYFASINKYWCSIYKSANFYCLVIRHESRGLLYHDYFVSEEIAFEAFLFALKVCRSSIHV